MVDYLCIGHCCHDVSPEGYVLGGTAAFSSVLARSLGLSSAVVTSVGKDFLFKDRFKMAGVDFLNHPATHTTVYENRYQGEDRSQLLHNRATTIKNIPGGGLIEPSIVHLSPIADEVDIHVLNHIKAELKGATIQGWLRAWDNYGKVYPKAMDWSILSEVEVVLLSEEDIVGIEDAMGNILKFSRHVVVTKGSQGASLYYNGSVREYPVFPAAAIDYTGAGDTFATAYLIEYFKTGDPALACKYAHCAASIVIEHKGLEYLPTDDEVRERLMRYQG
jgi:sugar/nucleoside kinase (ribokinase family)